MKRMFLLFKFGFDFCAKKYVALGMLNEIDFVM